MMAELGLPMTMNLQIQAAYLKHWLDGLTGDSKFIFRAAAQASKAVDFLLSSSQIPVTAPDPVEPVLVWGAEWHGKGLPRHSFLVGHPLDDCLDRGTEQMPDIITRRLNFDTT